MSQQIVVAGASGYIGKALIRKILDRYPGAHVTALSRSVQDIDNTEKSQITWKSCDLFSLKSIEEALPTQADLAFYLVHSMGPTAQLDQGSFADYDLILADNFARAIKASGVAHLIYLGGLIPDELDLSLHLQSRLEVEETFFQYKLPITVFRAGLILGDGGSSFQILLKLVKRLPIMLCPRWTQTLTTPVDLETVLQALLDAALDLRQVGKIYDLAGCQPLTYVEMMRATALKLGLKRAFLPVPFFTPTLSRLWVSLITQTPKDLVYPLVESLEHPMVADPERAWSQDFQKESYFEMLDQNSMQIYPRRKLFTFRARRHTVRSVQRLPLPANRDAHFVCEEYFRWLPQFLSPFIKVRTEGVRTYFCLFSKRWVFLVLTLQSDRSNLDRQLLYITDGLLVSKENRGRLEFRVVLNRRAVLAAIHDYTPSLPWYLYVATQALIHLVVMKSFSRHLKKIT